MPLSNYVSVQPEKFAMEVLPSFAAFLLTEKLDAYVEAIIAFSQQEQLPLLQKLEKLSMAELVELGKTSHGETLQALSTNSIHLHIETTVKKWVTNTLEVIDKEEVVAEDITLSAYIKRKTLQHFLHSYTEDVALQAKIRAEIDLYTTQEELISYMVYIKIQQEKLNKTNNALQFHEALLLEAQEISELGSFFVDYKNPENSMSTPQMRQITGLDRAPEEIFFSHVHPEDLPEIRHIWEHALENGGPFEYSFRFLNDGTEKKLQARGIVVRENGQVVQVKGTLRDITQNDLLIRRLTESELLHKEAQKLTHLGNWSWNVDDNTVQWSDEMYRIYGLEPQSEVITFERFIGLIHPDSQQKRIAEIQESLQTGIVKDYTLKIVTPAGAIKILRGYGNMETTDDGRPLRLVGTCQDITNEYHLKNELIALNHTLSQKNEELMSSNKELESFNYIASHDLQEPLRKIQLYTEKIMLQTDSLPETAKQSLEKVMGSASRMRNLISDLMDFSQVSLSDPAFERCPLDILFVEATEAFSEAVEAGQVMFHIDKLPEMSLIRFQFLQLLSNIFSNAIKYKKEGVTAQVRVTSSVVASESIPFAGALGQYLKIEICDNGIGFDPAQKDRIFELFKRLHASDQYSGTGIGLAICKKIVQNHKGFITAQSTIGEGSCFNVYLPFAV